MCKNTICAIRMWTGKLLGLGALVGLLACLVRLRRFEVVQVEELVL